jgi:DNA polymerase-3 subunit epsilon
MRRSPPQLAGNNLITIDEAANSERNSTNSLACRPSLSDVCRSDGKALRANRFRLRVGAGGDAEEMNTARDFVVVDVETSGFDPAAARVLSVAALTITAGGAIEHSMYTLLNPGVDPGPTNIHGLTPAMLADQPCYADIAEHLAPLLCGHILVAHNAAFDYAFLAAEARRCDTELPVTSVLCTLELAALLDLDLDSLSLAALARQWNISQARPHDALDDARVLAAVLRHALARAAELEITLPIRSPATLPPVEFHTAAA